MRNDTDSSEPENQEEDVVPDDGPGAIRSERARVESVEEEVRPSIYAPVWAEVRVGGQRLKILVRKNPRQRQAAKKVVSIGKLCWAMAGYRRPKPRRQQRY